MEFVVDLPVLIETRLGGRIIGKLSELSTKVPSRSPFSKRWEGSGQVQVYTWPKCISAKNGLCVSRLLENIGINGTSHVVSHQLPCKESPSVSSLQVLAGQELSFFLFGSAD